MINISNENENYQELENLILQKEFDKIKNKSLTRKSFIEISLIYEIMEKNPTPEIIDEIIFGKRNLHVLIKHDALIRAIELGYLDVLNKVVLFSPSVDLIKTALNYIHDDLLLKFIVLGANINLSVSNRHDIQILALGKISNENIFDETFRKAFSILDYENIFKKIKHKSTYKTMSKLQKRLIPLIISLIPNKEVYKEFTRFDKYPTKIIDLITN